MDDEATTAGSAIRAVVLTHGEARPFADVIEDLVAGGFPPRDILVVHNEVSPSDRQIQPAYDGIEVLRLPGNPGYAVGMNTGIRHQLARGADWVWLLTHDVRMEPRAVHAMCSAVSAAHGYGVLGPVLAVRGTAGYFSKGGRRDDRGGVSHAQDDFPSPPGPEGIAQAVWLDGSSMLLRAAALDAVGLYDESLYGYAEDSDLCLRLERAGWKVGVVAAAVASQETGHASRPGAVSYLQSRNGMRYRRRVAGGVGVAEGLRREARDSIHYARMTVDPRSATDVRRFHFARLVGTWAGIGGYFAGASGAPPTWLPGLGEMGKTGATRRRRLRAG